MSALVLTAPLAICLVSLALGLAITRRAARTDRRQRLGLATRLKANVLERRQ